MSCPTGACRNIIEENGVVYTGNDSRPKPYVFIGDCARLIRQNEENLGLLKEMLASARTISQSTFEKYCGPLTEDTLSDLSCDPDAGFYKSRFGGVECVFYQYAGFEFVFVRRPDEAAG